MITSLHEKLESIQYNAYRPLTGAIKGHPYRENLSGIRFGVSSNPLMVQKALSLLQDLQKSVSFLLV